MNSRFFANLKTMWNLKKVKEETSLIMEGQKQSLKKGESVSLDM